MKYDTLLMTCAVESEHLKKAACLYASRNGAVTKRSNHADLHLTLTDPIYGVDLPERPSLTILRLVRIEYAPRRIQECDDLVAQVSAHVRSLLAVGTTKIL